MPLVVPIRPTAIEPLPGAYPACPVMAYAVESCFNGFAKGKPHRSVFVPNYVMVVEAPI